MQYIQEVRYQVIEIGKLGTIRVAAAGFLLAALLIFCPAFLSDAFAGPYKIVQLSFQPGVPCTIENAAGQKLLYDGNLGVSGDMDTISEERLEAPFGFRVEVELSESYTYTVSSPQKTWFYAFGEGYFGEARADGITSIKVSMKEGVQNVSMTGTGGSYRITTKEKTSEGVAYFISGAYADSVSATSQAGGVKLSGVRGRVLSEVYYGYDGYTMPCYLFGDSVISCSKKTVYATNAAIIPTGVTEQITRLCTRPVNTGKAMFTTWNKVKGAKSYKVYSFDYGTGKYQCVATRNGNNANFYYKPVSGAGKYRYVVKAYSAKNGGGKQIGRTSSWVTGLTAASSKANAAQPVITSQTSITRHKGATINARYKIAASPSTKPLLDRKVRWYCKNSKVVKVNISTGKITCVGKGKATVWCKAHNGRESKAITIIVK